MKWVDELSGWMIFVGLGKTLETISLLGFLRQYMQIT